MRRSLQLSLLIALLLQGVALADSPAELGRRLFYDIRLSGDGTRSCADCHDPEQGFSKQFDAGGALQRLSVGYTGSRYFRNAPTLINSHNKQGDEPVLWGWDGRMRGTLTDAIALHLESPRIMNMDPLLLRERMKQDVRYVELCQVLFDDECRHKYTVQSLAAFIATLNTLETPFDSRAPSLSEKRGKILFEGKAGCSGCHSGPLFSDQRPHNTGVPENPEVFSDPQRHLSYRSMLVEAGIDNADEWYRDIGYFAVSGNVEDLGKFVTPTLRELRYTAPYMHNGVFESLAEVIDFYDSGSDVLQALGLSSQEKLDLIAFLESLSSVDPVAVQIDKVSPDYLPMEDWLDRPN